MKKVASIISVAAVVVMFAAPTFATDKPVAPAVQSNTNTFKPTNTNVGVNQQGQAQGQKQKQSQGQVQGQKQGQNNDQTIAPTQSTSIDASTNFDRYAPSISAPGLTSGGIGICLGSFSGGLTGPMAGIAFGKTTVDQGCSQARDSMILHNMGHKGAALRVLAGASIKEALEAEGLMPVPARAAKTAPKAETVVASTVEPVVVVCKDTELRVKAGNGEYFCRAN